MAVELERHEPLAARVEPGARHGLVEEHVFERARWTRAELEQESRKAAPPPPARRGARYPARGPRVPAREKTGSRRAHRRPRPRGASGWHAARAGRRARRRPAASCPRRGRSRANRRGGRSAQRRADDRCRARRRLCRRDGGGPRRPSRAARTSRAADRMCTESRRSSTSLGRRVWGGDGQRRVNAAARGIKLSSRRQRSTWEPSSTICVGGIPK